ncbi:MAG: amino acid adenylation domain-containing protein [Ferruginibacter sp.]
MAEFSLAKMLLLIEKANGLGVTISFSGNELSVHVGKGSQIDQALLAELKENKPYLIQYFQQHAIREKQVPLSHQLHPFNRQEIKKIPLSFAQERLWFIDQLEGSLQYHLPTVLRLTGKLNLAALNYALENLLKRHEILRTIIREEDGKGYQYIKESTGYSMPVVDGRHYRQSPEDLQLFIKELIRQPFDLAKDDMLRTTLVEIATDEHVLVFTMHHIASDAWSTSVLVKEVAELYGAFAEGYIPKLLPLEIQYADYAVWQRNYLSGDVLDHKINYWKEKLAGLTPIPLSTDHERPAVQTSRGANVLFTIDKKRSEQLLQLSQQQGTTLYMTLLAVFKVLLYRYSGQQDIAVGTSIARRDQQALEGLIGFFVNTLVLRNTISGNATFTAILQQVKATMLEAYSHQDVPFEKVVEAVVKERDPGRNPLFQVMLVLGNTPAVSALRLGEMQLTREAYEPNISKFDITFFINETGNGLQGKVEYSTDLFNEATIRQMIAHFEILLKSVVNDPFQKAGAIPMLTAPEEQQLLETFNDSQVIYPTGKSIVDLFEEQVIKTPYQPAIVFEEEALTYKSINERSNQLAHYLKSKGIQPGSLVPIYVERSAAMMIAMLGIMKAGAAYVPVDTDFPPERISYMLEDTGASVVICSRLSADKLPVHGTIDIITIDGIQLDDEPGTNLGKVEPHQAAYVIYTSGSTGKPKGVIVEHRSLVDYYYGLNKHVKIDQCQSFALVSTIATDLGNTVIYASLLSGGALHIFSKESVSNIEYMHRYFSEQTIDCLKIVPSHWKALTNAKDLLLPAKLLVFGGEALQSGLIESIQLSGSPCRVVNHYGPTETTIGKLLHEVKPGFSYGKTIPTGKPFSNTTVYVLSKELQLCPIGVAGQLYIAGDGLARGYFRNPELTVEKFIQDPFAKQPGTKMYSTGDLVKWLPDGNIAFIGRVDDQVKIRGYRIELGEIESILQQSYDISQAVVLAKDDKQGNKKLVAYIVANDDFNREVINGYLKKKLPDYMIPSVLMELDSLPLTANGKVDRKALPDPDSADNEAGQYVAPRNETEERLATIWEDILEVEQVGINDDFFELGGHSLLAVRLVSAIRKAFTVEMPIGDIFEFPTVALLAGQVGQHAGNTILPAIGLSFPRPPNIPLSFSQERLWFIDQLAGSQQYHVPAVLKLNGHCNKEALSFAIKNAIDRHQVLRTVFHELEGQPYQVIIDTNGWELELIDGTTMVNNQQSLQKCIQQLILKPYNLSTDYMLRASLIQLQEVEHMLVVTLHHIASDGWSRSILVNDFAAYYREYEEGTKLTLPMLPVQYADFAIWQRNYLKGEMLEKKMAYWKQKLAGVSSLQLPTDYQRPSIQSTRGAIAGFNINQALTASLNALCQKQGTTLFITLLAAFKVLLHRYTGQQDICVGTPIAGRQQQEVEGLIGFFVNTLALRSQLDSDQSFEELLQQEKIAILEAYANQEVPFEKVVESVVKERDMSRSPIFQAMLVLRNTPDVPELHLKNCTISRAQYQHTTALFDMTFFITENEQGLQGAVEYSTDLFSAATINRMMDHFLQLLQSIVQQPMRKIGKLTMLAPAEVNQLLVEFNDTKRPYSEDKNIVTLFEDQVERTPDAIAMVFEDELFTYKTLNEKVNKLADYLLQKYQLKPDETIGVMLHRSAWSAISMMAIIKTGACYLPIDYKLPDNRLQYIISDAAPKLILSSEGFSTTLDQWLPGGFVDVSTINLDVFGKQNPGIQIQLDSLSYVIYTSGSTGMPKGVMQTHRTLYNLIKWGNEQSGLEHGQKILQYASFAFDSSLNDIYFVLANGGAAYILNEPIRLDFEELAKYICTHQIEIVSVPFSALSSFFNTIDFSLLAGHNIRHIISTGEQLVVISKLEEFLQLNPHITLHNLYGPSETHVVTASWFPGGSVLPQRIPIGKPIDNSTIYILDKFHQPVPVMVQGEVFIGGDNLARGYLKNEALTSKKFIRHFFKEGEWLYTAGDIGRWLPDGNIEYLGRIDDQVKIRGYRIELGEIENLLKECVLVQQAVVLAKDDENGNKRLVGYVVAEGEFDKELIADYLKKNLPDYMVPSLWVEIKSLPLTPNGKVDKRALPNPDLSQLSMKEFVAPRNTTEAALTVIWKQLLGIEKVGVNDNFFELGGHSLLATRTVSLIRKKLEVELSIKDLFIHPTVALLAAHIATQNIGVRLPAITMQSRPQNIPLSFSQERLWFFDKLEGSLPYHLPAVLRLKGNLNREALALALQQIINRHEVLRTVIREEDGQGYQLVQESNGWQLNLEDGSSYNDNQANLKLYIQQLINHPFNLAADHMLRAHLVKLSEADHILVVTMHHIASDGWSVSVLVKEVVELYSATIEQRDSVLVPLEIQYADFAIWQRNHLQGILLEKKLGYWKEKLQGVAALQLPVDYQRPAVQSNRGGIHLFTIENEVKDQLQLLSQHENVTLFMTLLAVFNVLLHRYSGQQDICVGIPIAGRQHQEVEALIGFFINTLALRSDLDNNLSFKELLQQVKQTTLDAYDHQEVPFEKVVESVVKDRDMSRSPLFQVMFMFQNTPEVPQLKLGDLELSGETSEHLNSKYDLTLTVTETAAGLRCCVEYCTDLFKEATIIRMMEHFTQLIQSIMAAPAQKLDALPMMAESEKQYLLNDFNQTAIVYPADKSIVDLFEEQVLKMPENVAVVFEEQQLSYRQLNAKANQFAHYLLSKGVQPETLVPICIERSSEMMIGILGIMKAGAAYVPIDPEYPADRISYMLEDTGAAIVVSSSKSRTKIQTADEILIIELDDDKAFAGQPDTNLTVKVLAGHLAYVIYTSGSTGKPKGVMIEHTSVVNLLMSIAKTVQFNSGSNFLSVTTYSFDISYLELYMPLICGGSLVIASREVAMNGFLLAEKIAACNPTHLQATPSTWQILLDVDWENKEGVTMLIGGEAIKEDIKDALTTIGDLYNCYGPTETTIWSVIKKLEHNEKVVIGKPVANTNIAILSPSGLLCPIGVAGEICIGGAGLARGYFNRPELTASKFINDPFGKTPGAKLYRTGDLGRWLADGNIECLGRLDEQVKIRGFRIELGEIETVLEQCDAVEQAVVMAKDDKQGNKRLIGYIVPNGEFEKEAIIQFIKGKLPVYMVPALWVSMESLPLTPNGKINRKALPDPDISALAVNNYVAPRNETEEVLAAIWQELLGVERIGINDNFFELGGHSLLIIKMVSLIRKQLSFTIPVLLLFQFTTISDISKYLEWQHSSVQEEDTTEFEVLSI